MRAPILDDAGHGRIDPKMGPVGIAADQNLEWHGHEHRADRVMPGSAADRRRRQVRALGVVARKAEGGGNHRHARQIVEHILTDPEPVPKPVAGGIGEGPPGLVNPQTRRLAGDQDARRGTEPDDRTRRMARVRGGKPVRTKAAGPDIGLKVADALGHGVVSPLASVPVKA